MHKVTENTEATIDHLIAADGMPGRLTDTSWTIPEGMDCPWDSLTELLDELDPTNAEWFGGVGGLRLTFADDEGETVTESFQPVT